MVRRIPECGREGREGGGGGGGGETVKYVTASEKTDHLAQVSDFELLVPRCSVLFTLCNGKVRIVIAHSVLE